MTFKQIQHAKAIRAKHEINQRSIDLTNLLNQHGYDIGTSDTNDLANIYDLIEVSKEDKGLSHEAQNL